MEGQLELDVKACFGKTIGDKYKSVNGILKKLRNNEYSDQEIRSFLESWTYTDCPTMILYLSFINFTKNRDVVIKLLTSENDLLVCRSIKICTFFWDDRSYTLEFYAENIFPFLSHSNRNNLFKALAKRLNDKKLAEAYFERVKQTYGTIVAKPFLMYCSSDYILDVLKNRIVLKLNEIKQVAKKDAEFVFRYIFSICELKQNTRFTKFTSFLDMQSLINLIVIIDIAKSLEILDLNKKWLYVQSFGRKITKRILKSSKSLILNDPKYYENVLKSSVLFRILTPKEYDVFYKGLFPKEMPLSHDIYSTSYSDWERLFSYLNYYKNKDDKRTLLLNSYRSVYDKDLLADPKNITPNILKLLETEQRVQFAKMKIEKCEDSDIYQWIAYFTCDEAISTLKQEIYVTPDPNRRSKYLEHMITSCCVNDDISSMLEVLKYFNMRHRNEECHIKSNFVQFLQSNAALDKFTLEHWDQVSEIIAVAILNHDIGSFYGIDSLFVAFLKYCLHNNIPLTKYLKQYLKWSYSCVYNERWNLFKHNKDHELKCLLLIGKLIPDVLLKDCDTDSIECNIVLSFLDAVTSWNKRYLDDTISVLDFEYWTVNSIKKIIASNDDYDKRSMAGHFKYDKKLAEYFAEDLKNMKCEIDVFNLKTTFMENPELVLNQINLVYKACSSNAFVKSHLIPLLKNRKIKGVNELRENLKSFFLKLILNISFNNGDIEDPNFKESMKLMPGAIKVLSYFISADEFYPMIKKFYPESSRVDISTDTTTGIYDIQKSIAISIKNYPNNLDTFEALKVFCAGDYLQLTVGSLNSVCVKSSLSRVAQFLKSCIDVPVAFKKHVIRLLCLISDRTFVMRILEKLWTSETNPSIRHILIKHIFNIFSEEPNKNTWEFVNSCIGYLSIKDKQSINTILNYENVPDCYLSEYVRLTWTMLNKLDPSIAELKSHKARVLDNVVSFLNLVSDDVIKELLQGHIFRSDACIMYSMCTLAAHYILNGSSEDNQCARMHLILHDMRESFEQFWNLTVNEEPTYVTRKAINYFIETLCTLLLTDEKYKNKTTFIPSNLLTELSLIFDPSLYIYSSYMKIRFTVAFKNNDSLKEFGKYLRLLIDEEITIHGMYIIHILTGVLNEFMNEINKKTIEVADGLLSEPIQSIGCAYLAMNIITVNEIFKPENENILNRLLKLNDRKVNIMLNMFH